MIAKYFSFDWWMLVGLAGQFFFFMRFAVQWWMSEKAKESVIPMAFWYFSIAGALMILIYAVHIRDPIFIFGNLLAFLIYSRNIHLRKRNRYKQVIKNEQAQ